MALAQAHTQGAGAAAGVKAVRIHAAGPEHEPADSMITKLIHHGGRGAQVERSPVVASAKNGPDRSLQESQPVVTKVLGKIGVVGDDQRQVQSAAVRPAAVIERGDAQKCWIGDVDEVRLKLRDGLPDGGAWKGEAQLGIESERPALHADDARMFKLGKAAGGRKDENLVAKACQLPDGLAKRGDNAVNFGNECLSEERDSHGPCIEIV